MASYTLEQCDAAILDLEAQILEAAGLPNDGSIGGSSFAGIDGMDARLERQLRLWRARRGLLLNGGVPVPLRRAYGGGEG